MRPVILVVAADSLIQQEVGTILRTEGYVATTANSGESALWMVSIRRPDLLIINRHLPDMDGAALYRRLHRRVDGDPIPMIWLTGYHETVPGVPLSDSSVRVMPKPFSADTLMQLVTDLIAEQRLDAHGP